MAPHFSEIKLNPSYIVNPRREFLHVVKYSSKTKRLNFYFLDIEFFLIFFLIPHRSFKYTNFYLPFANYISITALNCRILSNFLKKSCLNKSSSGARNTISCVVAL